MILLKEPTRLSSAHDEPRDLRPSRNTALGPGLSMRGIEPLHGRMAGMGIGNYGYSQDSWILDAWRCIRGATDALLLLTV